MQNSITLLVAIWQVSVSAMNKIKEGLIISIAHYGKQNGDLMADPYIEILYSKNTNRFYPISYRNDYLGKHSYYVKFTENGDYIQGFYPKQQRDLAVFVGTWMRNIKDQQNL